MPALARQAVPATTVAPPAGRSLPVPRQRRGRPEADLPLGSLTQREHRQDASCPACGGTRLTRLVMQLADGAAVDFLSCHHCEHRSWEEGGRAVAVAEVLQRSGRR